VSDGGRQVELLNTELSSSRMHAAETEDKLTAAVDDVKNTNQQLYVIVM